jgi:hypothetical protein
MVLEIGGHLRNWLAGQPHTFLDNFAQASAIRHFFVTFHPNHSQTFVDNLFTSKLRARRVQQHHTLV